MATCTVNSQEYTLQDGLADTTLLEWLREQGLVGTKLGCGEGGCGACTVMVSSKLADGKTEHKAVNACLCPAYSVIGCSVTTVEGIGNNRDGLHPVQERLASAHGSQCGFCTPGFVMSMYSLLQNKPVPTVPDIEDALAGNLCRCTGYRPILDAFVPFTKEGSCEKATANGSAPSATIGKHQCQHSAHACVNGSGTCAKKNGCKSTAVPSQLSGAQAAWHRCSTLEELLQCKAQHPDARIIGGNTEVGIEMHIKGVADAHLIDAAHVPELGVLEEDSGSSLMIGGGVTLTKLMDRCVSLQSEREKGRPGVLQALEQQLRLFAGVQIRNVATVAGNIVTASPISDLNPLWVAAGAEFLLQSASAKRTVPARNFFLGYRKADIKPDEVLVHVKLALTPEHEILFVFKQAHRRDDDIAIVNAAIRLRFTTPTSDADTWSILEASVAYGGVGPTVVICNATSKTLQEHGALSSATVQAALQSVSEDVDVPEGAPGGMAAYRNSLARAFLFKALVASALHLRDKSVSDAAKSALDWALEEKSAATQLHRPPAEGVQFHAAAAPDAIVGQPVQHRAADLQVCGHAKYTADMDLPPHTLHAALVPSPVPHAKLLGLDSSAAEALPGVHGVFSAKDVPGTNETGAVFMDEHVFAVDELTSVGQVVAVVVADSASLALRASRLVKVLHEPLSVVMSIDDAIAAEQYHPQYERTLEKGDVEAAFASDEVAAVVEGDARMGGQEHFYLEPHCNFVQPIENDEFLLVASTQDVTKHQKLCAKTLGVPQHKLVSKTKRLGGGFGGKETRSAFLHCAVAVAAFHLRKPVKLVLPRQHDMQMTGHRHAFMGRYKVAAAADGRILALDLQLYANAGNSVDLSHAILDRAILHSDCGFDIPAVRIAGRLCRTNQSSNTAFRGFGGPQGMLVANTWMDALAQKLCMPLQALQERNLYSDGAITHYGQKLEHSQLRTCWDKVLESSGWSERRQAVESFNASSRHRKRGLAVLPTKFGISFTFKPMNQAGALVSIFLDGSVSVAHGGVEMGQGLHTKMCQVAAAALKVPLQSVHVAETSTDKVPNSSPTAASASSDLYGAAILDACTQLNERLAPIREKLGQDATMGDVAAAAWMDRVDLCAHGFYKTPDITGADGDMPFNYFVYGAAVCEAEVDCLTGDWYIPRCDIVMDVGNPINPAIDIGQVEGGFVQGMGWACMEELKWGDSAHPWVRPGTLMTNGPGAYKIPTVNDVPVDFRVSLLRNAPNKRAVHSSKAVGEPPFHLGASVLFAIKDAIYACRSQSGLAGFFNLDAPCTPERIRMACGGPLCTDATGNTRPALSC